MTRPTCGTCPHRVNGACFLQPAEWQDADSGPPVSETRPGCQHHPAMGKWLAGTGAPAVPEAAELEQWRKAFVWHKVSIDHTWSLVIVRNGSTLSYVMPTDGNWLVGRGGQRYPTRDAAMRAAEAPFGLPKCRVEGEP